MWGGSQKSSYSDFLWDVEPLPFPPGAKQKKLPWLLKNRLQVIDTVGCHCYKLKTYTEINVGTEKSRKFLFFFLIYFLIQEAWMLLEEKPQELFLMEKKKKGNICSNHLRNFPKVMNVFLNRWPREQINTAQRKNVFSRLCIQYSLALKKMINTCGCTFIKWSKKDWYGRESAGTSLLHC